MPDSTSLPTASKTIRATALAGLIGASLTSVQAAGPFQVRRAAAAQALSAAPPFATIATSPFDSDSVSSQNGTSYYFAVYDVSGNALEISVQANPGTRIIRIGFDDANAVSAPVDANASSLSVAPPTIRADGLQTSSITIVPRDANGVLLGRGLAVTIDAPLLWPAHLSGPIADLGDGTYRAIAAASLAGTGAVRIVVEGVDLAPRPTITATPVDPAGSLRDLAIQQLAGLAGGGGPLAALAAQAGSGTPQAAAITSAMARANAALATLSSDDVARDDNVLKTDFDNVLSQLAGVLTSPGALNPLDVRDAMDDLLGIARLIALWHIERATTACGVCDGSGHPRKLCDAIDDLASADAMRAAVSPDWGAITDKYARAVQRALQALQSC